MTSSIYCEPGQSLDSEVRLKRENSNQSCLLDVMSVRLTEMDLRSAKLVLDTGPRSPVLRSKNRDKDIVLKDYYFEIDENRPLKQEYVLRVNYNMQSFILSWNKLDQG